MFAKPLIHAEFVFGSGDSAGPRFPGERRVSLAQVCDFNGHQAFFQAVKGIGRRGWGGQRSNENHPSCDVTDRVGSGLSPLSASVGVGLRGSASLFSEQLLMLVELC